MKKKIKPLVLTLSLCITMLSLTACGNVGEIYDFFTDSEVGDMLNNLENLDSDDIKDIIENLDESDFEGLLDDLSDINKD